MTSSRNFALLVLLLFSVGLVHAQTPTDITAQLTFTTIDVPGAGATGVQGINTSGEMVGVYGTTNQSPAHAFILNNGVFSYFDYPNAYATFAYGINDSSLIVGYAEFQGGSTARGFLFDGSIFTPFRAGNSSATFGMGINNANLVVGGAGTIYTTKGFKLRNGHFQNISPPGTNVYVYATGINNLGRVVGWTDDNGFAYSQGSFRTIAFPGAARTQAHGISDNGVIIGWYATGSFVYGFSLINGSYTSFGYPGAKGTFPLGINASGQVVGSYTFDYTSYHGFVTSPIVVNSR
jgi:uncharacterized membrane protein